MAKRKNPLKDLDSFLKKEATSFVTPEGITDDAETTRPSTHSVDKQDVLNYFSDLMKKDPATFRAILSEVVQQSLESTGAKSAQDKLLLNTMLYLNHTKDWKTAIKEYWESR